jgi:glycosyltransferase involved in cell wall biosynthesis
MNRRLVFVFPPESDLVSGGNIYNRELVAAARRHRPIEAIADADLARAAAQGAEATFFIDTVSLPRFLADVPPPPARPPGQRFFLIVHHLPSLEPGLPASHPSLAVERDALPRFDGFLATSPYTASLLRARGHAQPCLTVRPALPARERPPLEYRPGVRALLVANLIPRKGVLPFLEALAAGLDPGDDLAVDVVGRDDLDPEHAVRCLRAAEERGLTGSPGAGGRVVFRGPVPYDEMDALYRGATAFLSPSSMETFGMALQEARAFGVPILARRGGNAAAHVEHGVSGYLYDTVDDLVAGLLALVRAPDRMRQLFAAAQALRTGSEYTWGDAAAELLRQLAVL